MDTDTLWRQFNRRRSAGTRESLILAYMPLVRSIAAKMSKKLPPQVEVDDLVSYGTFGLIEAIDRFDQSLGFKFETYATARIRGAILDGLRAMDWVPRTVRSQAREIEERTQALAVELQRVPTEGEVADSLGWDQERVSQVLARQTIGGVKSLDDIYTGPSRSGSPSEPVTLGDTISDWESEDLSMHLDDLRERLAEAIGYLPNRERAVVILYYLERMKFSDIGQLFEVSESRVCQIHMKAIEQIREHLSS